MKKLFFFISVCLLLTSCSSAIKESSSASEPNSEFSSVSVSESTSSSSLSESADGPSGNKNDWNLILINKTHPISENYSIPLIAYDNNNKINKRIKSSLDEMNQDAKSQGINLFLRSAFRTYATQKSYYDSQYNAYIKAGLSSEEAAKKTAELTAPPGCSEHQTGLALDIISVEWQNAGGILSAAFEGTDAFRWLNNNAYRYGFVLRYMKDKTTITGYSYEPWHYRYVGTQAAQYMKDHNLCLEEYLKLLDE